MTTVVPRWTAHELTFESERTWSDPFWDVDLAVELTAPGGRSTTIDAFWDGGSTWRARVRPDEVGEWHWRTTTVSVPDDAGLEGRSGSFRCVPYEGPNPVYRHGPVRVADDGHSFAHADGTPFLWLGDTVWNGLIRSEEADWNDYLGTRRAQGFSVIQFFSTHWRALAADPEGQVSYTEDGRFSVNPRFYQRLDPKVAAIADHGLLASAMVVLSLYEDEPGWAWPAEQLVRFARWMRARWGAYHVAWTLGGDGDFSGQRAERWFPIGEAVYSNPSEALVTMHPRGRCWVADEFRDQSWLTFLVYQSGHSAEEALVRWLPEGPHTTDWQRDPPRPIVSIEPNYEDHPSFGSGERFTAAEVRRASYWSLLVTPPAGVGYGHFSLWAWATTPELVGDAIRNQPEYTLEPWWTVLDTPGARSMTLLRQYFASGPWWDLRPTQALLAAQPGDRDARRFVAAARTIAGNLRVNGADSGFDPHPLTPSPCAQGEGERCPEQREDSETRHPDSGSGEWTVVYLPVGVGTVDLRLGGEEGASARWFDPRTGYWHPASATSGPDGQQTFKAPSADDWVLDLRQ